MKTKLFVATKDYSWTCVCAGHQNLESDHFTMWWSLRCCSISNYNTTQDCDKRR